MGRCSDPQESGGGGPPVHGGRAARFRHCLKGPDKGGGGSRLGQLRTMRRRPRLLPGNDRRRTPEPCQAQPICAVCCGFGRGSTPFSPAAAMTATARLFLCALCHCQVVLCRRCDHGNIYCSPGCGAEARRRSLRRAGRRYQDSRRGRHKHAERQRRYRERCRLRELENRDGLYDPFASFALLAGSVALSERLILFVASEISLVGTWPGSHTTGSLRNQLLRASQSPRLCMGLAQKWQNRWSRGLR